MERVLFECIIDQKNEMWYKRAIFRIKSIYMEDIGLHVKVN